MPFEDGVFPVGSRAESIFRRAYGDTWMIIPQPQEQVVHTRIDNLSISYENYISDFHQFIDINESLKKFYEYKQYNVKALESVETNIVNRHKLNSIRHKIRIENNLKNKKTDLKMMLKNRDYDKLNDIFEDYYQHQLDSNFMKWDIYIDINDEYLYIALMLLIIQGEYFNALKILKLRERESILSRELSVVKELALAVRDLSILIYDENNYIEAETLLKKWFNLFPDILDFKRHNLLLSIYFAKDKNEFNQIKKNAYKYLEQHKNDGELLKFLGDVYFSLNDRENAINVYLDAILITRNGILLEQIYTNLNELSVDMDTVKAYIIDRDEECERDTEEIT